MVFRRNSLLHLVVLSGMFYCPCGMALTIAEKIASLEQARNTSDDYPGVTSFNSNMREYSLQLKTLYDEARNLRAAGVESEVLWKDLLTRISDVRRHLREIEELWAAEIHDKGGNLEDYALWNHPETTIYNLVTDYGVEDTVYLVPQDIGAIKIATLSKFVVPKESFEDCLIQILSRLGIGVRQVNPWIKELYMMRKEGCGVAGVFSSRKDLESLPETAYIGFILNSNIDAHTNQHVLKKFINPETTHVDVIAGRVWIFGVAGEVDELLKIYSFVQSDSIRQEYRIIPLTKIDAGEMISILNAAFREDLTKDVGEESLGLRVVPLQYQGRSLFLSGTSTLVQQALTLIRDLEEGIENPTDKTIFWYNVKHSDPQELAVLLSQVHDVFSGETKSNFGAAQTCGSQLNASIQIDTTESSSAKDGTVKYGNFIADSKTGTLIMVVEKEALPRLQMLLKKLDVPKKMVRIEVLLFERKLAHEQKSGLNLLRLGEEVCKKGCSPSISWAGGTGILEFLFKGATGCSVVPGYDLAYQFLMAQEDVRINASPSVVTMNQTPARIAVVDEMSIAVSSDKDKSQYNRAQYGIMIKMLPVINMGEEDGKSYITLETDITFDTTGKNHDDRPDVTRRNITNKVRIADGETVIIGGLRCKQMSDSHDGIPFLGDIPGIGKLFGMSSTSDSLTEMFVFITPKILENPIEQQERKEEALLSSRPGEGEEFRQALLASEAAAKAAHKKLEMLPTVGLPLSYLEGREYDGY
ncbi:Pullulanase secretion envelope pulD,putative outer membrane porin HofQ,Type II secretory pathway, component HofQ,type II secretion system protein D,Bacterial type II and III secretion system protein [Chlamydia serpentis]|uniref:Pullulanase secretion envelope pulD,putative outer membrane porin HofQ,Type II secretory pathway, component HofQ,type II secretion system protein D,Bacterial type II and III secretion system protein n=1 Tax=Chlamydia serpentis TaxID=1967782 RepID=A0A2R8FCE2_9CHLA|nr:type II secretion system protein GspD [Chlamydia serpentis]SPN73927.1 Pullulanase secretion envelope pulD,putative outer membrane porin HofQ,Type II secretory pathway, component HofQ,type II secretion system protein D,Bacterial type II and III secretion system protein [Chlamydia serpentis]